jgi:hypothetical protein
VVERTVASGRAVRSFYVKITAALAAELVQLAQALDDPATELFGALHRLADTMSLAVPSYLGLDITIVTDGLPVTLTALQHRANPGQTVTWLYVPLPAMCPVEQGSALCMYAGVAGAFVDLAADLSWLLDLDPESLVLDQHVPAEGAPLTRFSLTNFSLINQAIGVLIERGHTPKNAHQRLHTVAANDSNDLTRAAAKILSTIPDEPASESPEQHYPWS